MQSFRVLYFWAAQPWFSSSGGDITVAHQILILQTYSFAGPFGPLRLAHSAPSTPLMNCSHSSPNVIATSCVTDIRVPRRLYVFDVVY